jgi:hypothetical protein
MFRMAYMAVFCCSGVLVLLNWFQKNCVKVNWDFNTVSLMNVWTVKESGYLSWYSNHGLWAGGSRKRGSVCGKKKRFLPCISVQTSSGSSSLVLVIWARAVILTSFSCEYWAYSRGCVDGINVLCVVTRRLQFWCSVDILNRHWTI